jgi:toxin ParE1/3/4
MKHKLHYSRESRRDLDDIWDYLVFELQNLSAAEHVVSSILDSVEKLIEHPFLGAPLSSIIAVQSDYRFLVTGTYLTFYHVRGNDIYIDRVLNSRQNYLKVLLGDTRDGRPTK